MNPEINSEVSSSQPTKNITELTKQIQKKDKKIIIGSILLGLIPIAFILYLVLGPTITLLTKDMSAKKMFIIAEGVNFRTNKDYNSFVLKQCPYGTKVVVYERDTNWSEVVIDGQKGFVSTSFLVEPRYYYELEGIMGNKDSRKLITKTRHKIAILDYFNKNNYMGNIPDNLQKEIYELPQNKEIWQVFGEPMEAKYNAFTMGDLDGDFRTDMASVIKNNKTGKSRLIILGFDKDDPENKSNAIYTKDLDEPYFFIRLARLGSYWYLNEPPVPEKDKKKKPGIRKKRRIDIDGLIIGSNRNPVFKDPVNLMLYDGKNFVLHSQEEKPVTK